MGQRLILPIERCAFSAGYKNEAYRRQQGYAHYGVDLYSEAGDFAVRACGNGEVVAAGEDGDTRADRLGLCCVILYRDVMLPTGKTADLACRMFHFDALEVSAGGKVKQGERIGQYGNTGSTLVNGKPMGKHLHIEFDADAKYPRHAVGIKTGGRIIRKGTTDSTLDPSGVWYLGEGQTIRGVYPGWYKDADLALPRLPRASETDELADARAAIAKYEAERAGTLNALRALLKALEG